MSKSWDAIVIGGGHNGLAAATLLARGGGNVLLLEARQELGGLAASEEFHPGYRTIGIDHDTSQLRPWVLEKLKLSDLDIASERESIFCPAPAGEGAGLLLHQDPDAARGELGADADSYAEYRAFLGRLGKFARRALDQTPADLSELKVADLWSLGRTALELRMLGKADMMELFRIGPMCVADWLGEWFENDRLKATLAAPAVYGGFVAPWSPGTNANLLLHESFANGGLPGGGPELIAALSRAATEAGVEIRTGVRVLGIDIGADGVAGSHSVSGAHGVCGVKTDNETFATDTVAGACSPKHLLLDLVPPESLTLRLEHRITHFRTRGTMAKVHLALTGLPSFACRPDLESAHIRIGEGIDPLEQAFDPIKYRRFGTDLALDIRIPTLRAEGLAPKGHHVMSIGTHYVPYELEGGWNEESRAALLETVLQRLEIYAPKLRGLIAGTQLLVPSDIEAEYGAIGGQIHHGEHGLDQLFVRPTPECARYATPIRGLYLCGSGSYPGGGLTGVPGVFGAERVLADA